MEKFAPKNQILNGVASNCSKHSLPTWDSEGETLLRTGFKGRSVFAAKRDQRVAGTKWAAAYVSNSASASLTPVWLLLLNTTLMGPLSPAVAYQDGDIMPS